MDLRQLLEQRSQVRVGEILIDDDRIIIQYFDNEMCQDPWHETLNVKDLEDLGLL